MTRIERKLLIRTVLFGAVLTAVVVGSDGTQAVVSAALDPDMLKQVQELLHTAEEDRDEEVPCVGFHCLLKKKDEAS